MLLEMTFVFSAIGVKGTVKAHSAVHGQALWRVDG